MGWVLKMDRPTRTESNRNTGVSVNGEMILLQGFK